ncbi:MAG TPA: hypothetical protein VH679_11450 [Vicinamibacterales bacterium]|jgi:hypothetical protein
MQIPSTPVVVVGAAVAGAAGQQTEIDRVLWNFNGAVITTTDVWQARQLKLVAGSGNDEILRALQNRQLILLELRRVPPAAPAAADVATRRREWEASLGPGADVRGLLTKAGMSEKACDGWITDDLRIRTYLRDRFGMLPEAERGKRTEEWLSGLRQRAGLGK